MTNIYRIQVYHLIMCAYSGIGFNDIMLKSQSLLHFCFLTMIMRKMIKYY